jgi:hypothetical protein
VRPRAAEREWGPKIRQKDPEKPERLACEEDASILIIRGPFRK